MKKVFIIAEAGVNHNGDISIAKKLVDEAKKAGANAIKFQTFTANKLVTKYIDKANYQKENTNCKENQYNMIKKLELSILEHMELYEYCKRKDIMFLSSPFDNDSIELLNNIGMQIFKIPSGEITNLPYLEKIRTTNKKIILSTGMSTLGDIENALDVFKDYSLNDITILHCNSEYPTPMEDVNLDAMLTIKNSFKTSVGYSDHTIGIEVPIAAVALGADVIEKHFTLDKKMEGPDHLVSLNPKEFNLMVKAIRNIEKALGTGIKKPSKSEENNISKVRKSIVASKDITKGEELTVENITTKRAGKGISPMRWYEIIGRRAAKNFKEDELISL